MDSKNPDQFEYRFLTSEWDPVANGIRCYSRYHGIGEDESRQILESYGAIDHIKKYAFMIEHYGSEEEAMILRRVVEHNGGTNPPLVS